MTSQQPCDVILGGLTEYLEGAAPPRVRRSYDGHLHLCPRCTTTLRQLIRTVELLRSLPPERIPCLRKHALIEAFRGRQNAS